MSKLDIGAIIAAQSTAPAESRSIEVITDEVLALKQKTGEDLLQLGKCLIEAKQILPHGEWLPWLNTKVDFSERAAQVYMRIARECTNPHAVADLGLRKYEKILSLPANNREEFMAEAHIVNGEEKNVVDMSARELEQAIRERKEALAAAAEAEAKAKTAEEARAKMESDMTMLKGLLESAQAEKDKSDAAVADLEQQLAEVKAAPVEVAVMQVDQEALDKARADAIAEMQDKLDKAKEDKAKAVEKRKAAEEALAAVQSQLEAETKARKQAMVNSDKDLVLFQALIEQGRNIANQQRGVLMKVRQRENQSVAQSMQNLMISYSDYVRRAAE